MFDALIILGILLLLGCAFSKNYIDREKERMKQDLAALEAEERKVRGKVRQLEGEVAVLNLREQEVQLEIQQGTAALAEAHKQLQAIKALAQKRNALRRDP